MQSPMKRLASEGALSSESIAAEDVKASDVIQFDDTLYKVRSVLVKSDHVQIVYWGTNGEQPYWYERQSPLHKVTRKNKEA